MARTPPTRTETSSTTDTLKTFKDSEVTIRKVPITPTNTRDSKRYGTSGHRKLVFCDPVAFRYLEEDDSTIVVSRRERLQGFELYVVEQWICSRVHPTFVIATYTGDPSHSILVNVLAVPNDENNWSKRLKIYFDAISQFQAREQETPLGTLMVTNLSTFPSVLTVIGVPDGDVRRHREDFIVNEDLKRMGCTGRAAMTLQPVAQGTMYKFQHLYQTSENIPFKTSVMELVRICQIALVLYGKLNAIYADGLLCDITEKAVHEWWIDIGTDFYNIEPVDGVLGPTSVSALLGLMIGAYNRIKTTGVNMPKDILDVSSMKRAIGHFQKAHKLEKTRRLDRKTLDKLHRVTAKTANSEGWTVPRAVKSTVAELSGKGGEMVMGAIGSSKEKSIICEVETLEIDKLAQLVPGAKMKWLWHGKPLKDSRDSPFGLAGNDGLNGRIFSTDDQGNFLWTSESKDSNNAVEDGSELNHHDKSGLKRLRGAVGIPGLRSSHHNKSHKHGDEHSDREDSSVGSKPSRQSKEHQRPDHILRSPSSLQLIRGSLEQQLTAKPALNLALANADSHAPVTTGVEDVQVESPSVRKRAGTTRSERQVQLRSAHQPGSDAGGRKRVHAELDKYREELQRDQYQNFATEFEDRVPESIALRRTKSAVQLREVEPTVPHSLRLRRHLSFELVEPAISSMTTTTRDIEDTQSRHDQANPLMMERARQELRARELQRQWAELQHIENDILPWARAEVLRVKQLDQELQGYLTELNDIYYQRFDEYQTMQATSRDLIAREKATLGEGLRKIETLGQKLDYELDALEARIQEGEDGLADFERNVVELEARVAELVNDQAPHGEGGITSWLQKAMSFFVSSWW